MVCDALAAVDRAVALARTRFALPTAAEETGLRLACRVASSPATDEEMAELRRCISDEMRQLWRNCRDAVFFNDVDYDQWGLEILAPWAVGKVTREMRAERPDDILESDLIIGVFRGDSDFVLLRSDPAADDFGRVTIGLPLDVRADWYETGLCLGEFLTRFFESGGKKFWELT